MSFNLIDGNPSPGGQKTFIGVINSPANNIDLSVDNLNGVTFKPGSDLSGCFISTVPFGSTLDCTNVNFTNCTFGDDGSPAPSVFFKCNLTSAIFDGIGLTNPSIVSSNNALYINGGSILDGTSFKDSTCPISIRDCSLNNVDFTNADLSGSAFDTWTVTGTTNFTGAIFGSISLSNIDFTGADFTNVKSRGNIINGSSLTFPTNYGLYNDGVGSLNYLGGPTIDFTDQILNSYSFTSAVLTDTIFTGASLEGTFFFGSNLSNATFTNATINGFTDFTDATLTNVKSGGITGTTSLPANYDISDGYIFGPDVNLSDAVLDGFDLSSSSFILTSANLSGASLNNTNLTDMNLSSATFTTETTGTGITPADGAGVSLPANWSIVAGVLTFSAPPPPPTPTTPTSLRRYGSTMMQLLMTRSWKGIKNQKTYGTYEQYLLKKKATRL